MADIQSDTDIELLVNSFYDSVRKDEVIGPIFNSIIGDDWSAHLPVIYGFWQTVLLHKGVYTGNVIAKHIAIDRKAPLNEHHYKRWLELWEQTTDTLFEGEVAENAKKRAHNMMQLISMKVQWAREGKSIL